MSVVADQTGSIGYDPETGNFIRLRAVAGHPVGSSPGYVDTVNGYLRIKVKGRRLTAHRLAWWIMTGAWPPACIDHVNGDRLDNRFANLRLATVTENNRNKAKQANNASGFKGVRWDKARSRWMAQIKFNGKCIRVGRYKTRDEAHAAYVAAASRLYGEFARTK